MAAAGRAAGGAARHHRPMKRALLVVLAGFAIAGAGAGCGRRSTGAGAGAGSGSTSEVAAPLDVVTLGPSPPTATTTVVLLHGYGAGGDDLVGLARALRVPTSVRFVLPAAPLALDAAGTARAWWPLDLSASRTRDRRDEVPAGLAAARAQVDALLDRLEAEGQRVVLGGFSQGAMLTVDVALQRPRPLAALAVLSGTRLDGAAWRAGLGRVRGVPVLLSHGTADAVLPVEPARVLRDELAGAGADVTWLEFEGGHTVPRAAVDALGHLITSVATAP